MPAEVGCEEAEMGWAAADSGAAATSWAGAAAVVTGWAEAAAQIPGKSRVSDAGRIGAVSASSHRALPRR